jgi:hypothetical protein
MLQNQDLIYLAIGWVDDRAENLPKLSHVPEVGWQSVHIEALGVQRLKGHMASLEPITAQGAAVQVSPVQEALGLQGSLFLRVLHKSVAFALAYNKNNHSNLEL